MKRLLAPIVLLALPLAASAQTAPQMPQTPGSNVLVTECDAHQHTVAQAHPWIDPYGYWHYGLSDFPYYDGFLAISYENRAPLAASEIDFGLVARGSLVAVAKDVGTFAPGAAIDHEFVVGGSIFPLGTALPYCAVMRVKYADGSEWINPTPPEP